MALPRPPPLPSAPGGWSRATGGSVEWGDADGAVFLNAAPSAALSRQLHDGKPGEHERDPDRVRGETHHDVRQQTGGGASAQAAPASVPSERSDAQQLHYSAKETQLHHQGIRQQHQHQLPAARSPHAVRPSHISPPVLSPGSAAAASGSVSVPADPLQGAAHGAAFSSLGIPVQQYHTQPVLYAGKGAHTVQQSGLGIGVHSQSVLGTHPHHMHGEKMAHVNHPVHQAYHPQHQHQHQSVHTVPAQMQSPPGMHARHLQQQQQHQDHQQNQQQLQSQQQRQQQQQQQQQQQHSVLSHPMYHAPQGMHNSSALAGAPSMQSVQGAAAAAAAQNQDVLSVGDTSQIGLSFATNAPPTTMDPYQSLSHSAGRDYANADFWKTVIDHNKQQQAAAAAAAVAAAAASVPLKTGAHPQLFVNAVSAQAHHAAQDGAQAAGRLPATSPVQVSVPLPVQPEIAEPRIEKPMLACDLCGRTFGQRGSLGRHKKAVHMGVRPFPCDRCGFCFQQRYDLRKHILSVHDRERPFACQEKGCKAAFSRRAKLRKHVTTVHLKQRDFICEICNSAFGEKSNKTKHIRAVHLQERKYQCEICRAAFKERGHRTKHMLTQHNVQTTSEVSQGSQGG